MGLYSSSSYASDVVDQFLIISEVQCRQPPTVANGRYKCQDPSYSYLSQCFLNCNTGFTLQGRGTAQCQADKKWNLFGTSSCIGIPFETQVQEAK